MISTSPDVGDDREACLKMRPAGGDPLVQKHLLNLKRRSRALSPDHVTNSLPTDRDCGKHGHREP